VKEPFRREELSPCIHTKNIYALLDLGKRDAMYNFLSTHEKKCVRCSSQLQKYKEENLAAKVFIPKPFMPKDLRETFSGELAELFRVAGLNEIENQKKKIKAGLLSLDHLGETYINNLFSKNMIRVYAFALIAFIGLRFLT